MSTDHLPACSTGNACPFVITVRAQWATRDYAPFDIVFVRLKRPARAGSGRTCQLRGTP